MSGIISFLIAFSIMAGIFAIITLGLNLQRGFTGLFNVGVAGFFAVGAYTSAILTKPAVTRHLGGFGLPIFVGLLGAAAVAGLIAFLIGLPTLKLKEDYLAIATLGIAESIRLVFTNETALTNGNRGIKGIPKPWEALAGGGNYNLIYLSLVLAVLLVIYLVLERLIRSPWGRVLRGIREDEVVVMAVGKNVFSYKMQALILGAMVMGIAGGLYAHYTSFVSPGVFHPMQFTFLIWVMLIVGGSGNNRGAILGAFIIWGIWSGTEFLPELFACLTAPFKSSSLVQKALEFYRTQQSPLRIIAISVFLELILLFRPNGLLGEKKKTS